MKYINKNRWAVAVAATKVGQKGNDQSKQLLAGGGDGEAGGVVTSWRECPASRVRLNVTLQAKSRNRNDPWPRFDNFCSVIATLLVCHSKYLLPFHLKPFPCTPVVLPLFRPFHFLFFFFFCLALGSIISKNLWCSTHKGKLENPEWGQAQKIKTKIRSNKRSSRLSRTFVIYYSPKFWPKRKNCKTNSF